MTELSGVFELWRIFFVLVMGSLILVVSYHKQPSKANICDTASSQFFLLREVIFKISYFLVAHTDVNR